MSAIPPSPWTVRCVWCRKLYRGYCDCEASKRAVAASKRTEPKP